MFRSIFLSLLIFECFYSFSQNSHSPYSIFGVGDIYNSSVGRNQSFGGGGYAIRSNLYLNPLNPASFTALDSMSFTFEFGMSAGTNTISNQQASQKFDNSNLNYVGFGTRLNKHWSAGMGLMPYSRVNSRISFTTDLNGLSANTYYVSSGGIYKLYWANGFNVAPGFSLGLNIAYLFGSVNKSRMVLFPTSTASLNTQSESDLRVGDLFLEYGAQYQKKMADAKLTAGFVMNTGTKVSYERDILSGTTYGVNVNSIKDNRLVDTIESLSSVKENFDIPFGTGFGISYEKDNKFLVLADIKYQDWTNARFGGNKDSLSYSTKFSVGLEYIPNWNSPNRAYERYRYRAGFFAGKTPYKLEGNHISDFGMVFGVGIPLRRSKTSFNFAVEFGQKGKIQNNMIKENYVVFTLNLSLSDIWFVKYKYQ